MAAVAAIALASVGIASSTSTPTVNISNDEPTTTTSSTSTSTTAPPAQATQLPVNVPPGFEAEVEHGQIVVKPHGGDDDRNRTAATSAPAVRTDNSGPGNARDGVRVDDDSRHRDDDSSGKGRGRGSDDAAEGGHKSGGHD